MFDVPIDVWDCVDLTSALLALRDHSDSDSDVLIAITAESQRKPENI